MSAVVQSIFREFLKPFVAAGTSVSCDVVTWAPPLITSLYLSQLTPPVVCPVTVPRWATFIAPLCIRFLRPPACDNCILLKGI